MGGAWADGGAAGKFCEECGGAFEGGEGGNEGEDVWDVWTG